MQMFYVIHIEFMKKRVPNVHKRPCRKNIKISRLPTRTALTD